MGCQSLGRHLIFWDCKKQPLCCSNSSKTTSVAAAAATNNSLLQLMHATAAAVCVLGVAAAVLQLQRPIPSPIPSIKYHKQASSIKSCPSCMFKVLFLGPLPSYSKSYSKCHVQASSLMFKVHPSVMCGSRTRYLSLCSSFNVNHLDSF